MPPPRKIDTLPEEMRRWLQDELKARGFSDYDGISEALSFRLEEAGMELRISRTAIHAYGQEFKDYAEAQKQAQEQIAAFLKEADLSDEIDVTNALFQQLTTLLWKLQMEAATGEGLDPRGAKDLTTALNNLIRSRSLRNSIEAEAQRVMSEKLTEGVDAGQIDKAAAQKAREIMGFA